MRMQLDASSLQQSCLALLLIYQLQNPAYLQIFYQAASQLSRSEITCLHVHGSHLRFPYRDITRQIPLGAVCS